MVIDEPDQRERKLLPIKESAGKSVEIFKSCLRIRNNEFHTNRLESERFSCGISKEDPLKKAFKSSSSLENSLLKKSRNPGSMKVFC